MAIIRLKDVDAIIIDLRQMFGQVIHYNANDAYKNRFEDASRMLIISQEDYPMFNDFVDRVIIDVTPKLLQRLDEDGIDRFNVQDLSDVLFEEYQLTLDPEHYETEGNEKSLLVIQLKPGIMSKEGLDLIHEGMKNAILFGVLSEWQEAVPEYQVTQAIHTEKYNATLITLANSATHRVNRENRIKISQRAL